MKVRLTVERDSVIEVTIRHMEIFLEPHYSSIGDVSSVLNQVTSWLDFIKVRETSYGNIWQTYPLIYEEYQGSQSHNQRI